jgi:hypothetical protein
MQNTANLVFQLSGLTFPDSSCSGAGGTGLTAQYKVSIVFVVNLTLTAKSCYPTVLPS